MRVVLQRVKRASVRVDGEETAAIGPGLVALVGFSPTDSDRELQWMARKISGLRIFEDAQGKMNRDVEAAAGELLIVSQFTLYGDCEKGKRPSFDRSAPAREAEELYERFIAAVRAATPCEVRTGTFQAHMEVSFVNDGPVTLILEKEAD